MSDPVQDQDPTAVALDAFEAAFRAAIRGPLEQLVRALLTAQLRLPGDDQPDEDHGERP